MPQAAPRPSTHSPETQALIELCEQVEAGNLELLPQLEARADERRAGLAGAASTFSSGVASLPEGVRQQLAVEIARVEKLFEGFATALSLVSRFRAERKPELLMEARFMLGFASLSLPEAMASYEQGYLSIGEHSMPAVNLFRNLFAGMRAGQVSVHAWYQTCEQYLGFYDEALSETEEREEKKLTGAEGRRAALEQLLDALEEFRELRPESAATALDAPMEKFIQGHEKMTEAVNEFSRELLAYPTPSGAVNMVLHTGRAVLAGETRPEVLRNLVELHASKIAGPLAELKAILNAGTSSAVLAEETAALVESFQVMQACLKTLVAFCDGTVSDEAAGEALDDLENCTLDIGDARRVIDEHNENFGKVLCPRCGAPNAPGTRHCAKCNSVLPQMTGSAEHAAWASTTHEWAESGGPSGAAEKGVVTDVMQALFEAVSQFQADQLDLGKLLEKLDTAQANVVRAKAGLSKLAPPAIPREASPQERAVAKKFVDMVERSLTLLDEGVDECELGLEQIRMGATQGDTAALEEGQRSYYGGCQKLWDVKQADEILQAYLRGEYETETDEPSDAEPDDSLG